MHNTINPLKHELIGLYAEIIASKNKSLIGIRGKIINESKYTLTVRTNSKPKKILKNQVKMKLIMDKNETVINGSDLIGRAEERLKK
ncbi:MAG: ribonuclease P protein subunit [Nanoarchaeota archaeon]